MRWKRISLTAANVVSTAAAIVAMRNEAQAGCKKIETDPAQIWLELGGGVQLYRVNGGLRVEDILIFFAYPTPQDEIAIYLVKNKFFLRMPSGNP